MTEVGFLRKDTGIGYQAVGFDCNRFYTGPKKNFVIYAPGNSAAMRYADENGFRYIQIR